MNSFDLGTSGEFSDSFETDTCAGKHKNTDRHWTSSVSVELDVFTAASIGDVFTVKMSIAEASSVNRGGWTALMYASYYRHSELVQTLLEIGCDTEQQNFQGRSSVILAAMCGNDEIIKCLVQSGANLLAEDSKGWDALFHATHLNHHSTVELLLMLGANPNKQERHKGYTPVILAACEGHELGLQHLLRHGGNIEVTLLSGETARYLAQVNGYTQVVSLIDHYANSEVYASKPLANLQEGPAKLQQFLSRNVNSNAFSRAHQETSDSYWASLNKPTNLLDLLKAINLDKYYDIFVQQDVDLEVFLSLADSDLKEIGILRLGPRRKMTSAIARWHSNAPIRSSLECVYADKLEAEMQELGVQLEKAYSEINDLKKQLKQEQELRSVTESLVSKK